VDLVEVVSVESMVGSNPEEVEVLLVGPTSWLLFVDVVVGGCCRDLEEVEFREIGASKAGREGEIRLQRFGPEGEEE